jgi:ribosomal protein L11 methyltransferase
LEKNQKIKANGQVICRELLAIVDASYQRMTPGELEKRLSVKFPVDKKTVKAAIRYLVLNRKLNYTYQFGCSFLEKSYEKPTRISRRVVLKPPGLAYETAPRDVVIEILKGASFGFGDHPTTRLAVQGIEAALFGKQGDINTDDGRALDIGTGSGVLAMAAVKLGFKKAVGIDIDPCARAEAIKNIRLNHLERQIKILDIEIQDIEENFSLITANLRYPTLKRLRPHITGILEKNGVVVVSGIKTDEVEDLLNDFSETNFTCTWKAFEKDWAGMVLSR